VKVKAVNTIGDSSYSDTITKKPLNLPDVPRNLKVIYDENVSVPEHPSYQCVKLDWDAPLSDGGSSIVHYTIKYSLDPNFVETVFSFDTEDDTSDAEKCHADLIIPYHSRETSTGWYYFKVSSVNGLGSGLYTNPATIVADVVPKVVQSLTGDNRDANSQLVQQGGVITLRWSYAVDDACPLLGFQVFYIHDADENSQIDNNEVHNVFVNDTNLNIDETITGLINGTEYNFTVVALNMLGQGDEAHIDLTPSTYPAKIDDLEIEHGDGQLSLSWSAPDAMGSVITEYKIYRSDDGETFSLLVDELTELLYVDTGLTNGITKYYKVRAINANGDGILSDAVSEYPSKIPDAPLIYISRRP